MKHINIISIIFILLISACGQSENQKIEADILIVNGLLFDGTGNPGQMLDIGILADRIVYVGPTGADHVNAARIIDAKSLIVAPGFIDPHTHSLEDLESQERHQNINYLTQGVTTVFNGNDGGGDSYIKATLDKLNKNGIGTNTALYVGHGAVREQVMGMRDAAPTDNELQQMKSLVKKAMEEGAIGLSTGLYYAPGSFSKTDEVIELGKVIAPYGGIYDSHIRDESSYTIGLIGAIQEVIDIGKGANIPVHIAHIKALGVDVWGQSADVIKMVEAAQKNGVRITADQYPWLASGTGVKNALMPRYALAGGDDEVRERLTTLETLTIIKGEMAENMRKRGGADALLLTGGDANITIGNTLADEAKKRGKNAIDTAIEIIHEGDSSVASFNMNEDDVNAFMKRPWVMTSSDGSDGHPRKFANMPTKYRTYVVDQNIIPIEQFIHRSTGLTAKTFGLCDRGFLETGKFADIVVFDSESFAPKADYVNPRVLSEGVKYLLVNGGVAISDGEVTEGFHGRALKHGCE
jgi:N-acyl-D-amino-acid deacylase